MKDILNQPKFKGDFHEDKPVSQFKARSEPSTGFAGMFGGTGSEVAAPMFQKGPAKVGSPVKYAYTQHPHGTVKNKMRMRP